MRVNTSHGPHATPNLRHLMLFDQVVRRGSVSAAARASHLSQPAVTQAVGQIEAAFGARLMQRSYSGLARAAVHRAARQLEKSLGTDLFEVTSFGVRPTREAARLALRTRLAFAEIAQAQAEVAAAQGTGSGSTVIGAMPLARSVLVPRAVLEF